MSDKICLICMEATAAFTTPGATYDRRCSRCDIRVMIAPSGQALLKEHPEATILCIRCYGEDDSLHEEPLRLPASPETIAAEMRLARANDWRNRN